MKVVVALELEKTLELNLSEALVTEKHQIFAFTLSPVSSTT